MRPFRAFMMAVAAAAVLFAAMPARALTAAEVAIVVDLAEALREDLGDLAYDEQAAADWYEEDSAYQGRIAAAGLSEDRWRQLVDATVKGFFAALGRAGLDEVFAALPAYQENDRISQEQKQAIATAVEETRARLEAWRLEGEKDAEIVRPYVERIKAVLWDGH
jgi:hypothetical protein